MILLFPDTDTLKLALTSSIVGPDVTLAPAALTIDTQGRLYVEPSVNLSRTTTKNLDRIGVKGSKRHGSNTPEKVANWLQIVPLQKETGTPVLASQAAVLFELDSADDLPVLVSEMLRLGNDKQSFRWFEEGTDAASKRVLLRVLGPPYYTLLRAIDKTASGTTGTVRAYLERAPRVWVEIGFTHPFAAQIKAREDQMLLIRSPRQWMFLDEAPFQDVYDILKFELPKLPIGWNETSPPQKMTVPLKLGAGNAADVPELWVLRDDALAQLDAFVRDAEERLTQRLTFAVANDSKGNRLVVLRTRPSKLAPPALPLENALGFKPFWKLPNLFLPAGKRLHPTLRRDAVRRLLADDPDQVVWLQPDGHGGFIPESVPDSAFRSLEDWVDYIIETEQAPLAAWIEATRFDFELFVCPDPGGPKPKPDAPDKEPVVKEEEPKVAKAAVIKPVKGKAAQPVANAELVPMPEPQPISAWRIQREGLEEKFMAVDGSLDDPSRRTLWPELAAANSGEGSQSEAAICWLNALWSDGSHFSSPTRQQGSEASLAGASGSSNSAEWLAKWVRAEYPDAGATIEPKDFDRRLNARLPSVENTRAVVAGFLWLASRDPVPAWFRERLPAIQKFFETHEASMPVRAVWLTGFKLAQLNGADVLGLARVRDRLLQRLLEEGLRAERDLPLFLRYAGLKDSARLRLAREKSFELHHAVRKWTEHIPVNLPYVDLMFSFALAKLGESTAATRLLEDAQRLMEVPINWPLTTGWPPKENRHEAEAALIAAITTNYCFKAYRYRINQALGKQLPSISLGDELSMELDSIDKKGRSSEFGIKGQYSNNLNPFGLAEYQIRKLLQQSRILESYGAQDPYIVKGNQTDDSAKARTELPKIREGNRFVSYVRRLYQDGIPNKDLLDFRLELLHDAIPLAPLRTGEAFTVELLMNTVACLDSKILSDKIKAFPPTTAEHHGRLLERSLSLAAHYNRADILQQLIDRFIELIAENSVRYRSKLINIVDRQCFRTLLKLGYRSQIERVLRQIQTVVYQQFTTIASLREHYMVQGAALWPSILQSLLSLAGGSLALGKTDIAMPILDEVRKELLSSNSTIVSTPEYSELARAYVRALAKGSSETGLPLIVDLFRNMPTKKITNTSTTSSYYSWFHLNLVEEVSFALISDSFSLGPACQRWLDDDEYIVRNRIHADMKRERDRSGL